MEAKMSELYQIAKLLRLPCVSIHGRTVTIRFCANASFDLDILEKSKNPVAVFELENEKLYVEALKAFEQKRRVLAEIANGRNRYQIVPGGFENVGPGHSSEDGGFSMTGKTADFNKKDKVSK